MIRIISSRVRTLAVGFALVSIAGTHSATAQTTDDRWHAVIAPSLWGASLDGTTAIRGRSAEIDVTSSDIFDHMESGFMGTAGVRKGDWGLLGDVVWVSLGVRSDAPPAEVNPSLGLFSLSAVRRINAFADATFGVRWNHLNGRITFATPPGPMELEKSRDWVDPTVGLILRTPGERRWHAMLVSDVGGFGVGSDLSWQLYPSVGVDVTKRTSMEFGWRFLDTDYTDGDGADRFEYDMLLEGPSIGLAFKI